MPTINERVAKVKSFRIVSRRLGSAEIACRDGDSPPIAYDWEHSIADAWELVEEMPDETWVIKGRDGMYRCCGVAGTWSADSAPQAICLAYLAVMEKNDGS